MVESVTAIDVDKLARLLTISPRRVQQLAGEGITLKSGRGRYDLVRSVQGYIRYLSDLIPNKQVDGSTKVARIDTEAHRSDLLREKAILARLQRQEKEGILVNKERERRDAFKLARSLRNSILNIPSRVAVKFAAESDSDKLFRSLEKELLEALEMSADMAESGANDYGFVSYGGEDCKHWCGR